MDDHFQKTLTVKPTKKGYYYPWLTLDKISEILINSEGKIINIGENIKISNRNSSMKSNSVSKALNAQVALLSARVEIA